jgi:DNA-binding transcriptional MerR regulator
MPELMTIGRLAVVSGVPADTIRYYEKIRLLPMPERTSAGYRIYGPHIVRRLVVIRNGQQFGFTLKQIAGFLSVRDAGGMPCHDVRLAAQRLLDELDGRIRELLAIRRHMRRTLQEWDEALQTTRSGELAQLLERIPPSRRKLI